MKTQPTILDIAKKANVSFGTVPRVLNGKYIRCKAETREKILKTAQEFGYRPNLLARALTTKAYHAIGILARDVTDAFFVEVMAATEAHLAKSDYRGIWLSTVVHMAQNVQDLLDKVRSLPIDGLIVSESEDLISDQQLLALHGRDQIYISTLMRKIEGGHLSSVTIDTAAGVSLLVKYLVSLGHRQFGFCHGPETLRGPVIRFSSFKRLLEEMHLPQNQDWYVASDGSVERGYRAAKQILKCKRRPTVIIAYNDLTALGCIRACMETGFHIPQRISVAGFDNIRMASYSYPSLTTVGIDYKALAKSAIDQMISMIAGRWDAFRAEHLVIGPELIVRESTAPPPH